MTDYPIYTEETECRDCYKCVSRCPVKAVRFRNNHLDILHKLCVCCGRCVTSCPASAKRVRSDVEQVKKMLHKDIKVFASLAPSFPAEFSDWTPLQLAAALKRLGFYGVSETALGADFVSADIAASMKAAAESHDGQKLFLSSACPAVVMYIKRYAHAFVPYLNDRASPLLAHAALLRSLYGKKIGVIFIGPCIAKKREADQFKEINGAITFDELKLWLAEEGLTPETITEAETEQAAFVPRSAAKGTFFPIDGGMLTALKKYDDFANIAGMTLSGIDLIAETLNPDTFNQDKLDAPLFLELLACQGGCVNGPCITHDASMIDRRRKVEYYAENTDDTLDKDTAAQEITLTGTLTAPEMPQMQYSNEEVRNALSQIGKYDSKDEVNCSMCGYETCRAFAQAMLENRAEKGMCVTYMRNLAQRKANALIKAAPYGIVIVDKNCKIVECNRNFARLLGDEMDELYEISPDMKGINLNKVAGIGAYFEDAFAEKTSDNFDYEIRVGDKILHLNVYVIEKGEVVAGVLQDITAPQSRRDRTVERARKIIEKNAEAVQKIAFLLGENAAETESILHSIIESHSKGEKKK